MFEWKQAWQLSKIELKNNIFRFIPSILLVVFLAVILGISYHAYKGEHVFFNEQNPGLFDIVFIALFVILPYLVQPKNFRYQQIDGNLWASPYFIKLLHLAIPEKVIIKNRFLTYFILSVPFHIIFLVFFYLTLGLKGESMSPITFVAFSIIWLSFGIYAGYCYPASDAGDQLSTLKRNLVSILCGGIIIGLFLLIKHYSSFAIVAWTIYFATNWPVLSSILSIFLAFIGVRFWMYHMEKTMKKIDYL